MGKRQALVIEDNKDIGDVYVLTLHMMEYDAELVLDGREALARLEQHQPDLIILDMNLPKVSGHYIYKQIRSDARMDACPIIIATANTVVAEQIEGELGPNDQILLKPISPLQLRSIIEGL
ncbi:MAG: hypothetical protein OHK0046_14110 [Anaerolineae bacterium]